MDQWTGTLIWLAFMFGIFYFLLIRPQQQQQRARFQMLGALKTGDRVITTGGMHGVITKLNDQSVLLRIAEKVEVEVQKTGIAGVAPQN